MFVSGGVMVVPVAGSLVEIVGVVGAVILLVNSEVTVSWVDALPLAVAQPLPAVKRPQSPAAAAMLAVIKAGFTVIGRISSVSL